MRQEPKQLRVFIQHHRLWGIVLLVGWLLINLGVLATSQMMEFERQHKSIPFWEPLSWEVSSTLMLLLLIPLGIFLHDRFLIDKSLRQKLAWHLFLTFPFSLLHIAGMVAIRHLWYGFMGQAYDFGDTFTEFWYEYRKDAQSYLTISLVVFGYRLIVRRLQGEASYIEEGDNQPPEGAIQVEKKPERLLIKKLGREFLIQVNQIEWVEASGNYANLHIQQSIYPMRITMEKLEKLLPDNFVRIHRSTIVDIGLVKEVTPLDSGDYRISLKGGKELSLSRRYRDKFNSLVEH